jgi:hypothetical protein
MSLNAHIKKDFLRYIVTLSYFASKTFRFFLCEDRYHLYMELPLLSLYRCSATREA